MGQSATIQVSRLTVFARLSRIQFIPLIALPALVGTALAFHYDHVFNATYLGLTLLGVVLLHLGANSIDDCFDYQNGVDQVANSMFPKDFGGWKPIPRGFISLRDAKTVSYLLFVGSMLVALYFTFVVGPWAFILGLVGVILAVAYTAPPLKLDYRGYGLGEIAILIAFGPIPVLGSFYVQTGMLNLQALLVSIPIGIITVTILLDHDLIFYEVYSKSKKLSLAVVLGKARTLQASLSLTILAYVIVLLLIAERVLPVWCVIAPLVSSLILARRAKVFTQPNEPPPHYTSFTANALLADWTFSLLLALTVLLV